MKSIVVGMSGGVDSSAAAYLLKKAGYQVSGLYVRTFDTEASLKEAESARTACEFLEIPFYIKDMRESFEHTVIDRFAAMYESGLTPNPCLFCNPLIKWKGLCDFAEEKNADLIATGHYSAICEKNGRYAIKRDASSKDQSYVLYGLSQYQLSKTVFPLSGYEKEKVREMSREAGIPQADKPDSMEICFIPDNDRMGFLRERLKIKDAPGDFVDENGKVLGRHEGIARYTVGQRKGLGIALGKRIFVKEIRPMQNQVVLADDSDVFSDSLFMKNVNFQAADPKETEIISPFIKIRYGDRGAGGKITLYRDGIYRIVFDRPVRAVSPGQAAVCYDDQGLILLGGEICSFGEIKDL